MPELLRSGADKIVVNTPLFEQPNLVKELTQEFGQQCVVGSVDLKQDQGNYRIFTAAGTQAVDKRNTDALGWLSDGWVGELYLNSIERDGTGQVMILGPGSITSDCSIPVILAGEWAMRLT